MAIKNLRYLQNLRDKKRVFKDILHSEWSFEESLVYFNGKLLYELLYEENSSSISAEGTKNKVPV